MEEIAVRPQSEEALAVHGGRTRNLGWSRIDLDNGLHVLQLKPRTAVIHGQIVEALSSPSIPELAALVQDDGVRIVPVDAFKVWFVFAEDEPDRMRRIVRALDDSCSQPTLPPADWCDDCGQSGATLRDAGREEAQLLCDTCFERWRSTLDDMRRIQQAQQQDEAAKGPEYPPLEPHESLTSERMWEISQSYEQLQREDPGRYWLWIRAWVWLGQLVLVGAALGTIFAVLSAIGIVIAALTISPWFALLLLKGKAIKLVLALVVGAFFLGWKAVRSVFAMLVTLRPKARELGGTPIEAGQAPGFVSWVAQVADGIGAPAVDEIRLMPGLNAFATEVRSGAFGHRKVLGIGLDLMEVLDPDELRAVVAHELGHLHHGDSRTLWVYRTVQDWIAAAWTYSLDEANLLARFARWYIPNFLVRARALARQHELRADQFSVQATDPSTAATALLKVHTLALIEQPMLERELPRGVMAYRSVGQVLANALPAEPDLVRIATDRALRQPPHWMDTHPALHHRLDAIGARPTGFETSFTPAITLLDDAQGWVERLAADQAVWLQFLSKTMVAQRKRSRRHVEWLASQQFAEPVPPIELRAELLADLGEVDEAITLLDGAIDGFEDTVDLRFKRAAILHNALRYEEARQTYQALLDQGDTHLVRLLIEGVTATFLFAGHLDEAIAIVDRALAAIEAGRIGGPEDIAPLRSQRHRLQMEKLMAA